MGNFSFWQKWLTWANVMALMVGLLVAFAGNSIFFYLHNEQTSEVFFVGQAMTPEILALKNWLWGIIGGTVVGFHLLMIFVAENAFKKKEKWAWYACWAAMISWFLIDSSISVFYGAVHNVYLINIFAMVLIGLPLIATRKHFFSKI